MHDTLITIALAFVLAPGVAYVVLVPPGGLGRALYKPRHGAAHLDARDVPAAARHYLPAAPRALPAARTEDTEPMPALTAIPDPAPFVRTAT